MSEMCVNANSITNQPSISIKDSTKTTPVTMKMDPKGFYVYWINQSKVINERRVW